MQTDVEKITAYLTGLPRFTKKHSLDHTRAYLKELAVGFSQEKVIHVAGTNGKGSVCNYIRSVLYESGKSVMMFTSPHLERITERVIYGDKPVEDELFCKAFDEVYGTVERCRDNEKLYHPTFFEYLFLMAMKLADLLDPDYLILETGLGGTLDATNVFEKPALTVITGIALDHQEYLGDTIEEIAAQKAGIIKRGVPLVLKSSGGSADGVIKEKARLMSAPVIMADERIINFIGNSTKMGKKSIDFSYQSHYYNIGLSVPSGAIYQTDNVKTALAACETLLEPDLPAQDTVIRAIRNAVWPCRMEEVKSGVIIDGAHNPDGMAAFLKSVENDGCRGKRILITAFSQDKAAEAMAGMIAGSGLFETAVATTYGQARCLDAKALEDMLCKKGQKTECQNEPREALLLAEEMKNEEDLVYITGSLYLAGLLRGQAGTDDPGNGRNNDDKL